MRGLVAAARVAASTLLVLLWLPAALRAQAWLPLEHEGAFSLTYQLIDLGGHFNSDGSRDKGAVPSRAHLAIAEFEYGLTKRLAFNAQLPYVASKYTGGDNDPGHDELHDIFLKTCQVTPKCKEFSSLDTGGYYATAQDFGFMLRYGVFQEVFAFAPMVAVTIPSHGYHTVGESAAGQNRRALQLGFNVGRLLYPLLVHAQYGYSFVEPLYGISLDHSDAEFEVGYRVTSLFSVRALGAWHQVHGGAGWNEIYDAVIDENGNVRPDATEQEAIVLLDHDRLLASRYWHLGAGATVELTNSLDLDGAVVAFPSGADTHYGVGLSFGLTWRFLPSPPASPSIGLRPRPSTR